MKNIGYIYFLTLCFCVVLSETSFSQDEKIEPRIDISYFRSGDDIPYVKIVVRKRIQRRYFPIEGIKIHAYFNEESTENEMGTSVTNDRGEGIIEMPTEAMKAWHTLDDFEFIALAEPTDSSAEASESISIHRARIRLTASKDSIVTAVLERKEGEAWNPVEEVELKLFIKRQFGRLPATENALATDAEGTVELEFDRVVPGDEHGVITLGCMLEDHEEFGNIIAFTSTKWGTPTVDNNEAFEERTLWSTRDKTPLWLLIFPNLIIAAIWGIIIYLIVQIIRLKKLSKSS